MSEQSPHPPRLVAALDSLRTLHRTALSSITFAEPRDEAHERLLARFERLLEGMETRSTDYEFLGREFLVTVQSQFPDLWPLVDRQLLWFFGGDCLHFLDDAEIDAFQAADDALARAAASDGPT
ncbi:MAG TPA: PA2817 family protein [Pseudomonadales bacterium]|nr:PA2817 family protein [Pseudomonadales bacterium]